MDQKKMFSRADSPPTSNASPSSDTEYTSRPTTPLPSASNHNSDTAQQTLQAEQPLPDRARRYTLEPEPLRTSSTLYHIKRTLSHSTSHLHPGIYEFDLYESFTDYFSAVRSAYTIPLLTPPPLQTSPSSHRFSSTSQSPYAHTGLLLHRQCDFASQDWPWGLGVLVRASTPSNDITWTIEIEIEDGKQGTLGDEDGRVYWPLFFVVVIEMVPPETESNNAPHWKFRSRIRSSWATSTSARVAARGALMVKEMEFGKRFARYEEKEDDGVGGTRDGNGWVGAWGGNVVVRAVDQEGSNFFVALLKIWKVSGTDGVAYGDGGGAGCLFG